LRAAQAINPDAISTVRATRSFSFSDRTRALIDQRAAFVADPPLIVRTRGFMTRRHRHCVDRLATILALAVSVAFGVAPAASDEPRQSWFTPRCAEYDIRALAVIEQFGEVDAMPAAWLANAGLNYLQARLYCLARDEGRGIALYDRIIAGDARMSNELVLK
jgi:hypothetical protein